MRDDIVPRTGTWLTAAIARIVAWGWSVGRDRWQSQVRSNVRAVAYGRAMNAQIDFTGILIDAIAGVPAHVVAAYAAAPDSWNTVCLGMLALLAVSLVAARSRRRPRPR